MAILTNVPNLRNGDALDAQIIIDTVDTAIAASQRSESADTRSETALTNSSQAIRESQQAAQFAAEAKNDAANAKSDSIAARAAAETANSNSTTALNKATDLEARANAGEFNGRDGAYVEAQGMFGFTILDGNLILNYSGDVAPDLRINANGELIYNV